MKIRIIGTGIYSTSGEVAVGTVIDVEREPLEWRGRYEIIEDDPPADAPEKAFVTAVGPVAKRRRARKASGPN